MLTKLNTMKIQFYLLIFACNYFYLTIIDIIFILEYNFSSDKGMALIINNVDVAYMLDRF